MHATGLMAMGRRIIDYCFRSSDGAGIPNYNTAGVVTFSASDLLQGLILRDCNGAARADLTPTAQQIIDALTVFGRVPVPGNCFRVIIRNTASGAFAITLTAGTGVTISGTATIGQNNSKEFLVVVNSGSAVTFYSLGTQVF